MEDGAIREMARQMKAMCFVTVGCWRRYLKLGLTEIRVEGSMGVKNSRYKLIVNLVWYSHRVLWEVLNFVFVLEWR